MSHKADDLPSTSSGNTNGLNFIKRNGGLVLLRAGYQYTKKRQNKNGWGHWRCVNIKECSGSLQLKDGIISNEKKHSCKPDDVHNLMLTKLNDLRETVINADFTPIPRIYNKFKSQFYDNSEMNLVEKIPSFKNIKNKLYKARNSEAGISKIKCKTVDEVKIPKQFQNFVFHDYKDQTSNTRIIILSTQNQLAQLSKLKIFQCDGTFDCCPAPFVQLYTIHGDHGSDEDHTRIIPLVYVLLNNKKEETYKILFEILKQKIFEWCPTKFLTDFEQAAINAISTVFPSVVMKGCYFHYTKNVWKKAKELNLTKNAITRRHVRLSSLMPLLPRQFISEGWCYIMEDAPATEDIENFNNYMVTQWLEDENFVDVWCVHGERHRTTNAVESWHLKLNTTVPKNANLYQLLVALKEDAVLHIVVAKQIENRVPHVKRCAGETVINNQWIKHVTDQLIEQKITVGHCLEKLKNYY